MVVVKGYADDTRQDGRSWVVTGYAANTLQWEFFEAEWPKMLARHGLPYVHMREMASSAPPVLPTGADGGCRSARPLGARLRQGIKREGD